MASVQADAVPEGWQAVGGPALAVVRDLDSELVGRVADQELDSGRTTLRCGFESVLDDPVAREVDSGREALAPSSSSSATRFRTAHSAYRRA